MKLTAILPFELNGRALGAEQARIRTHTFWKRLDFIVPTAADADAPVVMYWNAAFDDRHDSEITYVNREEWGPYPADGHQVVRYHGGEYWRQCSRFDVVGGDLSSPVLDTAGLEELFTYPERNDLISKGDLPQISRKKQVVADEGELLGIVKHDLLLSRARIVEEHLEKLGNQLLIVGDTVFIRCGEPKLVLTNCARVDRYGKGVRLLRIDTDATTTARFEEERPTLVFPVSDFEPALEEASDGYDRDLARSFNEIRRPTVLRPDLLPDIDIQTYRAIGALRRFHDFGYAMEITQFANPCSAAHKRLGNAIRVYDRNLPAVETSQLEECLEECEAAFAGEYYGSLLSEARFNFDARQISLGDGLKGFAP